MSLPDQQLDDLVGRLLMVGFDGRKLTPDLADFLETIRPGGIILFKRNVDDGPARIAELIAACQDLAVSRFGRRLLIAIDQEGGPVRRLTPPFTILPSQREMSRALDIDQVRALGETSGRELAAVGFNMNLAPVLDLVTDSKATFMLERSFGADPETASAFGSALIQGHLVHRVLTCAKHFPGIGDSYLDPHFELPTVSYTDPEMLDRGIFPFLKAIEQGLSAVITSHVFYPQFDPKWPATISTPIITGLLREKCRFSGLILSDDMEMGALVKNYSLGEATLQTVSAGTDLVLICRNPQSVTAAREALEQATRSGVLTRTRLEASAFRLAAALEKTTLPPPEAWKEVLSIAN
ncbi:MAG: glycoside hydrolase family 3 protein [Deltaproteobacteria bacterium]|nr:glycoside hydrolase family 3 protein [Deltaproteobacteria bacterium]